MEDFLNQLVTGSSVLGIYKFYIWAGVLDIVTGIAQSLYNGTYTAEENKKGLLTHSVVFIVITSGLLVGREHDIPMITDGAIMAGIGFFGVMYVLSVIENLNKMGIPVPDVVVKAMDKVRGKDENK